jgi:pyridoxamine 5'-phosphate oxidase
MREINQKQLANLRVDYSLKSFDDTDLNENPIYQFSSWLKDAIHAEVNEPNAMTLATVKENGAPSARIVLLKGFDENGFVFYTNYNSNKGTELSKNPNVALVFCWLELQRQVRIEGRVEMVSKAESDDYFQSRPLKSQIGAHASKQSTLLKSRLELENQFTYFEELFSKKPVIRPEHWGGFRVEPHLIEFWQGRQSRLHDRFVYTKFLDTWERCRLAP